MKIVSGFHILFFIFALPVIIDLAGYAMMLLGFYREDEISSAGGYPEAGTIDRWRLLEGRAEHFIPYFFMTMIITIFPLSLVSTLPRAISYLVDRSYQGLPSWTALIRLFICGFGFLISLFFVVVSAERGDLSSAALLGFSLASGTAVLILGAKIYSDPRLQTRREQGDAGKPNPAAS
ncbi:MAG: hypothetical protein P1U82_24345 [Verrucomicrobiales bacterium]|nr:hypothetical protein [Verrucomicrobiales bacterium]